MPVLVTVAATVVTALATAAAVYVSRRRAKVDEGRFLIDAALDLNREYRERIAELERELDEAREQRDDEAP